MVLNGQQSSWKDATASVPQGSIYEVLKSDLSSKFSAKDISLFSKILPCCQIYQFIKNEVKLRPG